MTGAGVANPEQVLVHVLLRAAEHAPDQVIVHVDANGTERRQTFRELRDESLSIAGGFQAAGLAPGTPVLLPAQSGEDFLPAFWGALGAGLVPVPVPLELDRLAAIWTLLGRVPVVVDDQIGELLSREGTRLGPAQARLLRLADLRRASWPTAAPEAGPQDLAVLQFTSGATGAAKCVELSHANILASLEQARDATAMTARDVVVSWLPYINVVDLICTHLLPLSARAKQVRIGVPDALGQPAFWLQTLARHRATFSTAPPSALDLAVSQLSDECAAGLDLSCVRGIAVGGEPISPLVWRAFLSRLRPARLAPAALRPTYGLAEATMWIAASPDGELARPVLVDRAALAAGQVLVSGPGAHAVELMDVGFPLSGCEVRIVDDGGKALGQHHLGHIEVRGPSIARGYWRATTHAAVAGAWGRTGDLGFLHGGRLCVTGRDADVICVNTKHWLAHDIEEVVRGAPGVLPGRVAAEGWRDSGGGVDCVVVFLATGHTLTAATLGLVARRLAEQVGEADIRLVSIPAASFPVTAGGTLQRHRLREIYRAGHCTTLWPPAPSEVAVAPGPSHQCADRHPRVVFVFAGQGSQLPGRGRVLYDSAPRFRHVMDELSNRVGLVGGRTLVDWCVDGSGSRTDLAQTAVAQPLLVAFEVALAMQLRAWGASPDAVIGHGVGELAAAAVSGAIDPGDAVAFAAERGKLMQELAEPGGMAVVTGDRAVVDRVVSAAGGALSVAVVNRPNQVVISGHRGTVDEAIDTLTALRVRARRLDISHGFHSSAMRPVLGPLGRAAASITPGEQQIPMLSTATLEWTQTLDSSYFCQQAIGPVHFGPAVERLLTEGYDTFVEIGPGASLTALIRAICSEHGREADTAAVALLDSSDDASRNLRAAVARLGMREVPERTVIPLVDRRITEESNAAAPPAAAETRPERDEPLVAAVERLGTFALTPAQDDLLLAEAVGPPTHTSWLASFRIDGPLDRERLQQALDALVVRHAMLRVEFPATARPPVQQELAPTARLLIDYVDLVSPDLLRGRIAVERLRHIKPSTWPLLHISLFKLGPDEHALLIHAHHLIGDAYSAVVFGQELLRAYDRIGWSGQPALPPLHSTFRDYVALLEAATTQIDLDAEEWLGEHFDRPYSPPKLRRDAGATAAPPATGFTLSAVQITALKRLAAAESAGVDAPLLTSLYRGLRRVTRQSDLMIGLFDSGRDQPLPDVDRLFGPFATAVPLRLDRRAGDPDNDWTDGPSAELGADGSFRADLQHVVAEVVAARRHAVTPLRVARRLSAGTPLSEGAPPLPSVGTQFLFAYLDSDGLGPLVSDTLTISWDDAHTDLGTSPARTDLLFSARPVGSGLRIELRSVSNAVSREALAAFGEDVRRDLAAAAATVGRGRSRNRQSPGLDAAVIGYLPTPAQIAAFTGILPSDRLRERIRSTLFPHGAPRLLEEVVTPLGRSGFICLPVFADELGKSGALTLAAEAGRAAELCRGLGARCVSLAGLIPALTHDGVDVLRHVQAATPVTSGQAARVVSVIKTVLAALAASRRTFDDMVVTFVGLDAVGRAALELLLARAEGSPAHLVLCELAGDGCRLDEVAGDARRAGFSGRIDWCEAAPGIPDEVYAADLIIATGARAVPRLDIPRLHAGTIVVDDSHPHCFDPAVAGARMQEQRDVLVVGGGLLDCGSALLIPTGSLPTAVVAERLSTLHMPGAVAACQLESLLKAAAPELPLVHGRLTAETVFAYWAAVETFGVAAAPLHLLDQLVEPDIVPEFARR